MLANRCSSCQGPIAKRRGAPVGAPRILRRSTTTYFLTHLPFLSFSGFLHFFKTTVTFPGFPFDVVGVPTTKFDEVSVVVRVGFVTALRTIWN